MRIPSRSLTGEVGFNMTPMIDVVFQLIIFFLVSSHIAKQEVQMKLPLPLASSAQKEEVREEVPKLTIHVDLEGQIFLAARPMDPQELSKRLRERKAKLGENQPLEVRIRGDRRAPYRAIEPVMVACAEAGIWNVQYSVYDRREAAAANQLNQP